MCFFLASISAVKMNKSEGERFEDKSILAQIDILLERGSLRPRIIEMNGQGDLIYQDIYEKNVIYRHQAEMMREWLWKNQR